VVWSKTFSKWSLLVLLVLTILTSPVLLEGEEQPTVQAAGCWKAEITEQHTDVDLVGSILRVSVQGKAGLPVVVRSVGSFETVGYTGTKPEYGAFVAEFAPLSLGTYYIEPEGLGIIFEVWLDGKNYTRVDFTPLPCAATSTPTPRPPTATPRAQATTTGRPVTPSTPAPVPTQPPQPATGWRGRVAQRLEKLEGRYFATIAVRVIGRPAGQEVEIRSQGWSATCKTGTKPEHGPDACEFGALNAGTYRLTPKDLGTHLDVTVGLQDFVLVEFHYTGPPPRTRWVGSVVENTSGSEPTEHVNSAIAVRVASKPWHKVEIQSNGWSTTCLTGTKPDLGPDACEFGGLRASIYTIIPQNLDASVQVAVDGWGWALVRFDEVSLPPPQPTSPPATATAAKSSQPAATRSTGSTATPRPSPTPRGSGWQGWVLRNTSGQQKGTGIWSVIIVRVINRPGVPINITSGGGWSATCLTGTKPEYGPDACEFGGLWPGTYYLQPQGADIQLEVAMDGLGSAVVEFAPP
jgi:hypothetical protein